MDEPFSALDAQTKTLLQMEFLKIWEAQPKTVLYVTHDLDEAAGLADRVVIMGEGFIAEDIPVPFERPRVLDELRFRKEFVDFTHHLWVRLENAKAGGVTAVVKTLASSLSTQEDERAVPEREATDALMKRAVIEWRRRKRYRMLTVRLWQVLLLIAFLGGWQLSTDHNLLTNANLFYGSPSGVWNFLVTNRSSLWTNAIATVQPAIIGFLLGSAGGVAVGLAAGRWRMFDRVIDPFLAVLAGLPRIALAPLFLLWFGITDMAKITVAVSAVFFVVLFNARAGVRSVQPELRTVAELLGASQRDVFRKVILPGSVPVLFAGLRLGMIFSVLGVIASEMVAAKKGLGVEIVTDGQNLQPDGVFAALAILALVMAVFNGLLQLMERRFLRWMPTDH